MFTNWWWLVAASCLMADTIQAVMDSALHLILSTRSVQWLHINSCRKGINYIENREKEGKKAKDQHCLAALEKPTHGWMHPNWTRMQPVPLETGSVGQLTVFSSTFRLILLSDFCLLELLWNASVWGSSGTSVHFQWIELNLNFN